LQAIRPIGTSVIRPSGNKDQQGLNLDRRMADSRSASSRGLRSKDYKPCSDAACYETRLLIPALQAKAGVDHRARVAKLIFGKSLRVCALSLEP
jgi:hypothetical protein